MHSSSTKSPTEIQWLVEPSRSQSLNGFEILHPSWPECQVQGGTRRHHLTVSIRSWSYQFMSLNQKLSDFSTSQIFLGKPVSPAPLLSVQLHNVLYKPRTQLGGVQPLAECREDAPFPQQFLEGARRGRQTYPHIVVHAHPQQVLQKVPVLPAPWGRLPRARKGTGIGS